MKTLNISLVITLLSVNLKDSDTTKIYTLQEIEQYGYLILINQDNRLPSGYYPENLVVVNSVVATEFTNTFLQAVTLNALEEMFTAAKNDNIRLLLFAGYRSEAAQNLFYTRAGESNSSIAPPRTSEHETGYAADILDINNKTRNASFGETLAGKWLADNCYKYGFILRYPKDKNHITKYIYEPWHYRYLGKETAEKVHKSGLCYEEYIKKHGIPNTN